MVKQDRAEAGRKKSKSQAIKEALEHLGPDASFEDVRSYVREAGITEESATESEEQRFRKHVSVIKSRLKKELEAQFSVSVPIFKEVKHLVDELGSTDRVRELLDELQELFDKLGSFDNVRKVLDMIDEASRKPQAFKSPKTVE